MKEELQAVDAHLTSLCVAAITGKVHKRSRVIFLRRTICDEEETC